MPVCSSLCVSTDVLLILEIRHQCYSSLLNTTCLYHRQGGALGEFSWTAITVCIANTYKDIIHLLQCTLNTFHMQMGGAEHIESSPVDPPSMSEWRRYDEAPFHTLLVQVASHIQSTFYRMTCDTSNMDIVRQVCGFSGMSSYQ